LQENVCLGHVLEDHEVIILIKSVNEGVTNVELPEEFCVGAILKWTKKNLRQCSVSESKI